MAEKKEVYYKFCQSYNEFGDFHELHMGQDQARVENLSALLMMIPTKHRSLESIKNKWERIISQLNNDDFKMVELK